MVLCHIAKWARWKEALEILGRIRGRVGYARRGLRGSRAPGVQPSRSLARTLQLLRKARFWETELGVASYNAGIRACRGLCQWEECVPILREMPALGVTPDVLSYNLVISACAQGCQGKEAVPPLREITTMSATGAVVPDVTTCSTR